VSKRSKRLPLYWRTWLLAGPGVLIGCAVLAADGHIWWALGLVLLVLLLFLVPWLLEPYSKIARGIRRPSDDAFKRWERLADWLGSIPVFGVVWRGAERMTGNVGRTDTEAYRRWLREQEDDTPSA